MRRISKQEFELILQEVFSEGFGASVFEDPEQGPVKIISSFEFEQEYILVMSSPEVYDFN